MKPEVEELLSARNIESRILLPETAMLAKIEASFIQGARRYCENFGYQDIPICHLTRATGACEDFNSLLSTEIFGQTAYLNQTGQLLLEAFMHVYKKTFCIGPSFRKERKVDARHLLEFNLFEIEVADMDLDELQEEISSIFLAALTNIENRCKKELEHLCGYSSLDFLKPPYRSMTYRQAIEHLGLDFGEDLQSAHEKALVSLNEYKPIFIVQYPKEIKFFNMRENRGDSNIVQSMDLLMPYSGESVGAAEREEDFERLKKRLEKSDMIRLMKEAMLKEDGDPRWKEHADLLHSDAMKRFDWYIEVIKNKPIKHSGCGIGVGRVIQSILSTNDIRNSGAFPINQKTLF